MTSTAGFTPQVQDWFHRRTWQPAPWSAAELCALKDGRRVSVVLPALDEEATVAEVVATVRVLATPPPGTAVPLVDEVVVMDGGSTDRTAERAAAAGARVVDRGAVLPGVPVRPGKGEVLWRSLAATSGDLLVFVDADLVDADPSLVVGLLGPLLAVPGVELVKGFYRRPLRSPGAGAAGPAGPAGPGEAATGGGRVTELVARPLVSRLAPHLAGVVQPLGGEYAGTRDLLESLPFAAHYGVEIGLLMDTVAARGLDAVAQVDLGVRRHRHRSLAELGPMARQVLEAVLARAVPGAPGRADAPLVQFAQVDGHWTPRPVPVVPGDRPPMAGLRAARGTPAAGRGTIGA